MYFVGCPSFVLYNVLEHKYKNEIRNKTEELHIYKPCECTQLTLSPHNVVFIILHVVFLKFIILFSVVFFISLDNSFHILLLFSHFIWLLFGIVGNKIVEKFFSFTSFFQYLMFYYFFIFSCSSVSYLSLSLAFSCTVHLYFIVGHNSTSNITIMLIVFHFSFSHSHMKYTFFCCNSI